MDWRGMMPGLGDIADSVQTIRDTANPLIGFPGVEDAAPMVDLGQYSGDQNQRIARWRALRQMFPKMDPKRLGQIVDYGGERMPFETLAGSVPVLDRLLDDAGAPTGGLPPVER